MSIIQQMKTEVGDFPILGCLTFWNLREVEVSRAWFKAKLDEVGLDGEKYSKEHNFRSTFIRCLNALEDQRIIRKVKEDEGRLIYQFTAEKLAGTDDAPVLEYTPETVVEIDKEAFWVEGNFADALTKCDEKLRVVLIEMFEKERNTYRSSDITRYVQKIFNDLADIVSLREQGSVYFVPATYQQLVLQVSQVLNEIPKGSARLEYIPVPDVKSAREMIGNGVEAEVAAVFSKMQDEITQMLGGSGEITDKWVEHRKAKIEAIKVRLDRYAEVLGETALKLNGQFDALAAVLKPRLLEV